ncbi:MAG: hypothetical protein R3E54_00840 [Halioglobus sp.]
MADELADATLQLCEKVKSCATEQMSQANLTPEMLQMMQPMVDTMCASLQGNVADVPQGHALYPHAVACMRSLADVSCAQMQASGNPPTAECTAYEEKARKLSMATDTP